MMLRVILLLLSLVVFSINAFSYDRFNKCLLGDGNRNNICYDPLIVRKPSPRPMVKNTSFYERKYGDRVDLVNKGLVQVSVSENHKRSLYGLSNASEKISRVWQKNIKEKLHSPKHIEKTEDSILRAYILDIRSGYSPTLSLNDIGFFIPYLKSNVFNIVLQPDRNKLDITISKDWVSKIWKYIDPSQITKKPNSIKIGSEEHKDYLLYKNGYQYINEQTRSGGSLVAGGSQVAGGQQVASGNGHVLNGNEKPKLAHQFDDRFIDGFSFESLYSDQNDLLDFFNNFIESKFFLSDVIKSTLELSPSIFPGEIIAANDLYLNNPSLSDKENLSIQSVFSKLEDSQKKSTRIHQMRSWHRDKLKGFYTKFHQKVYLVSRFPSTNTAPRIDKGVGHLYISKTDFNKIKSSNLLQFLMLHEAEHIRLKIDSFIDNFLDVNAKLLVKSLSETCTESVECLELPNDFDKHMGEMRNAIKDVFTDNETYIDLGNVNKLSHSDAKKYTDMLRILLPSEEKDRLKAVQNFTALKKSISNMRLSNQRLKSALNMYLIDKKIQGKGYRETNGRSDYSIDFFEGINHLIYKLRTSKNNYSVSVFNLINESFDLHKWYSDYKDYLAVKRIFIKYKPT